MKQKRIEKEGFEFNGFKLGQEFTYGQSEKVYKIIGFSTTHVSNSSNRTFVATSDEYMDKFLKESQNFDIILSGYENKKYSFAYVEELTFVDRPTIKKLKKRIKEINRELEELKQEKLDIELSIESLSKQKEVKNEQV